MTLIKEISPTCLLTVLCCQTFFDTRKFGIRQFVEKDFLPPVNVLEDEKFYQIEVAAQDWSPRKKILK